MRFGLVVWVGDVALAVRTPVADPAQVEMVPAGGGVTWWRSDVDPVGPARLTGPAYVASLVGRLASGADEGDELVEVTVVVPGEAAPHLESALGFAIPDVDVRVLPVDRAVSTALDVPLPVRVGEWRDGGLTWSGEPSESRTVSRRGPPSPRQNRGPARRTRRSRSWRSRSCWRRWRARSSLRASLTRSRWSSTTTSSSRSTGPGPCVRR